MTCASCGRANRDGARFCGGCGAALAARCASCGAANETEARFCDACGARLGAAPAAAPAFAAPPARAVEPTAQRKVVTIVFADLIGSTALHEGLDPESVARVMEAYHAAVRAPVEARGGSVVQLLGDGVMCAFGVPRAGEDDALRAVRAAVDVQRSFREFLAARPELAGRVGLRVAVNTGEVVVSDDYAAGIGDPLNVAARLQQEARDGDVLIGEATQRFVEGLVTLEPVGTFALKGRAEPVAAYRVLSLERPARAAAAAFVGRESELRRLRAVWDAAASAPHARLAVVLGSPGLGKSRLVSEFARSLGGRAAVLVAQCTASGGATFAPLAEALRHALEAAVIDDAAERDRITAGVEAILSGKPASPEESFFAVRRLLAALAAKQPVVLAIDDLHWAEPLLLDLVEHLVQWGASVPMLVLAAARPELREVRSSLASPGGVVSDVVTLGGLDAGAATRLAASVIGADALPAALAGRVLATSEGNPLFLAELVRMLVNDGVLRREGDAWVSAASLAELDMPPTIQALLAARLERLRPEERLVLERAAVIGRQFSRGALAHLLPQEAQADLDAKLEALRRSELIEPDTDAGWFHGEPALRFHHVLIRDAAYRRPLRGARAELHERFAEWLAERAGGDATAHDETIGWHLEQAFLHRRDLGTLDAKVRALGARAARHLAAAGRRALARDDVAPAASLLGRALDCLDADDPARAELALDCCEALLSAGDVANAAPTLAELGRFRAGSARLGAWHACFAGELAVLSDPQALHASADSVAAAAETLAAAGDGAGEAKAHFVHALVLAQLGRIGACEAALDLALAAARRAGDRRRANAVLAGAPVAALWGPSPVTRASGRCLDVVRVLRITQGAPAVEAVALRCQAVLETLRGRSEAARRMIASARRTVEELGITQRVLEADVFAGLIELLEGDGAAAEARLRPAYAGLRAQGLGIDAAQAAALLGRALLVEGRDSEAEALSRESEALAGDSFKAAIAWRGVRAEALAARGEHAAAIELARTAVEIAAATDDLLDHADARHTLAVALRAAGRTAEADAEEQRAAQLWEQKGATLLAERARRATGHSARPDAAGGPRTAPGAVPRIVRENTAVVCFARFAAAARARDLDAIEALCAEGLRVLHHPTGATIERAGGLEPWRLLLRAERLDISYETLATLGERLALTRDVTSFEGLAQDGQSFGPSRSSSVTLLEANEQGQAARIEVFAEDRLGEAVARLYARRAELLPESPQRARAEVTARSVAAVLGLTGDDADFRAVLSPELAFADHQRLGVGTIRGGDRVRRGNEVLHEVLGDLRSRVDEVLALTPELLVARRTIAATDRTGGGAVEYERIELWGFGADGLLARLEHFDAERPEAALARAGELAPLPRPAAARRVRPNRATENAARMDAAVAARDLSAFLATLAADATTTHHPTGTVTRDHASRRSWEILLATRGTRFAHEPLSTLGEDLTLCRLDHRIEGAAEPFSFGPADFGSVALLETDAEGLRTRTELFASERLGDALARLYARHAERLPEGPERACAENIARAIAIQLRVSDAPLDALVAPDVAFVDHRPLGMGRARGADALLRARATQREVDGDVAVEVHEILGLRPDALLMRWTTAGRVRGGGGAFERPLLMLWTYGNDGRLARIEWFQPDRDAEALARFDALAGEPSEAPFANAETRAGERHLRCWAARDFDGAMAVFAPGFEWDDRRALVGVATSGPDFVRSQRLVFDFPGSRIESEVLATRGERCALRCTRFTGEEGSGGTIEASMLTVSEVDETGRYVWQAAFDPDAEDAAYAALDARYEAGEGSRDAAWRALRAWVDAFNARDFEALAGRYAPGFELHEHRALGWGVVGSARHVELMRSLTELAPDVRLRTEHYRGAARACLTVASMAGTREGGACEMGRVAVREIDADGRVRRVDHYDLAQLGAARARFAELSPEAAPLAARSPNAATRSMERHLRAWAVRDWDAVAAEYAPGFRIHDRRRFVRLDQDREGWLASLRRTFEADEARLTPGDGVRGEMLATRGERLALARTGLAVRHRDVGPSQIDALTLVETDASGRRSAMVIFDADAIDDAFAELDARDATLRGAAGAATAHTPPAAARFENAAMRTGERLVAAVRALDWERLAALIAPAFRNVERQRAAQLESGREPYLAALREMLAQFVPPTEVRIEPLATRGERLVLGRMHWRASGTSVGPSEFEYLELLEVDDAGHAVLEVAFDPDAHGAALAELEARFAAGEAAAHPRVGAAMEGFVRAFAVRDWDALGTLFAEDAVVHDRRRLGWETLRGRGAYVAALRALVELSPDVRLRLDHVRLSARGLLWAGAWVGTREGGPFEAAWITVSEHDAAGRVLRFDTFDAEPAREAEARFAALGPADPLAIPPNAASRASQRLHAAFSERSPEAFTAAYESARSPGFRIDDRRAGVRLVMEGDTACESARLVHAGGTGPLRKLLATAGERLALEHSLWRNPARGAEVETLDVIEVDAEGRVLEIVSFDPQDRRGASTEMLVRYRRGEGARGRSPDFLEFVAAFNAHDTKRARALLPDDFFYHDHRRTGLGRLGSADDYVASLAALWEQSPDAYGETLYYVADAPHATLNVGRLFGTLPEGGAFESCFLRLAHFRGGRFVGVELFEPEDLERARVRFDALRPDALAIPPNLALRTLDCFSERFAARDWAGIRALAAEGFVFDDRRRRALVQGDVETWLENMRWVASWPERRVRVETLATLGERVAVQQLSFEVGGEVGLSEGEFLRVVEVDAAGRLLAWLNFDVEDRAAAFAEAQARFVAGEAGGDAGQAAISAFADAFTRHAWHELRDRLAPEALVLDHRTLGFGEQSAEGWLAALRVFAELAPDVAVETLRILAWGPHGRVSLLRVHGTREGGAFENVFVEVALARTGRLHRYEFFDVADAERAAARFAELRREE